jgi:hypothetical protein
MENVLETHQLIGTKQVKPDYPYFCRTCSLYFTRRGLALHLSEHLIPYNDLFLDSYLVGHKNAE